MRRSPRSTRRHAKLRARAVLSALSFSMAAGCGAPPGATPGIAAESPPNRHAGAHTLDGDGSCRTYPAPASDEPPRTGWARCGGRVCAATFGGRPVYRIGEAGESRTSILLDARDVNLTPKDCEVRLGAQLLAGSESVRAPESAAVARKPAESEPAPEMGGLPTAPPPPLERRDRPSDAAAPSSTAPPEPAEACVGFVRFSCAEPWSIVGMCWGQRNCP